jgi:hypothetical protein
MRVPIPVNAEGHNDISIPISPEGPYAGLQVGDHVPEAEGPLAFPGDGVTVDSLGEDAESKDQTSTAKHAAPSEVRSKEFARNELIRHRVEQQLAHGIRPRPTRPAAR